MTKKYVPGKTPYNGVPCKNGHHADRWAYNGHCVVCKQLQDHESNIKAVKKYKLKKHYGLTINDADELLKQQDGKCKICSRQFVNTKLTHIDHCHKSNVVRGILCSRCNRLLGSINDDVIILQNAINYLTEYKNDKEIC